MHSLSHSSGCSSSCSCWPCVSCPSCCCCSSPCSCLQSCCTLLSLHSSDSSDCCTAPVLPPQLLSQPSSSPALPRTASRQSLSALLDRLELLQSSPAANSPPHTRGSRTSGVGSSSGGSFTPGMICCARARASSSVGRSTGRPMRSCTDGRRSGFLHSMLQRQDGVSRQSNEANVSCRADAAPAQTAQCKRYRASRPAAWLACHLLPSPAGCAETQYSRTSIAQRAAHR